MKDIGLVGVPFSGKSTLFTALTRTGAAGGRSNQAVVTVPDPRLPTLAEMARAKKAVPAQVRFIDVPGGTSSAHGIAELRETDALCIVLRAFGPDQSPAAELGEVTADLLLADLSVVEPAAEKSERRAQREKAAAPEAAALAEAHAALASETLLRDAGLSPEHQRLLRAIALLTLKPWAVVANLEEGTEVPPGLPKETVGVYASIEAETAEMPQDEARSLLAEFGVSEPGLEGVIRACYRALDLVTFFTTANDETHAWQLPRGAKAAEAAGVIHTDMERGFIRTEVIAYDDLVAVGSTDAARHKGLVRLEAKDYAVREGDILHIRFAV